MQLQKLLLEVGDHLRPLLKLGTLCLIGVLLVDDPMGMDIHLFMCDVKQMTGVVPPMLGLTKLMLSNPQLTVLHGRRKCTTAKDGILMPQPLKLA
jgi:hypothetical protein